MADDSSQSRTEAASARRRREAREKGNVPFSAELTQACALIAALSGLLVLGPRLWHELSSVLRHELSRPGPEHMDAQHVAVMGRAYLGVLLRITAPTLGLAFVAAWASGLLQTGQNLAWEPLRPQADRINPQKGVTRLFHVRTIMRTAVVFLKTGVLGTVVWWLCIAHQTEWFASLPPSFESLLVNIGSVIATLSWAMMVVFFVIAVMDYSYQRWQYEQNLMMSRQELKEERKEEEGDAQIRSQRRRRQRDMLKQNIERDVPQALAVVVNPTHFAVAIRYEQGRMSAPQVVAKGRDLVAHRIIDVARRHHVPIVRQPELARTLYRTVKVGKFVPSHLFRAVAEIIAHIYRSRGQLPPRRAA